MPPRLSQQPANLLGAGQVHSWLDERHFPRPETRIHAGLILSVEARDIDAAALTARELTDQFSARARIATGRPLHLHPQIWVEGASGAMSLSGESRGVRVKELDREGRIFTVQGSDDSVEAAIELMAHLDESSPPAAIAGGWGAIEGLLADPGDRATAADNLASLVACSFPRQELTALSYKLQEENQHQYAQLLPLTTNRERSKRVAEMIISGESINLRGLADQAAVLRAKKILNDPGSELKTIRDSISEAFHRLYRQRNLVLHGGRLNSVALKASLRTVSKLAGAGMDRITHAHYVLSMRPLELAARANISIALITKARPLDCVDLLE